MARYIDADKLLEQLSKKQAETGKYRYTEGFNEAIMRVRSMVSSSATADVVPKSEVEKIFEEIRKILYKYDKIAERDKSEYGELIVGDIGFAIIELEKKYVSETS